MAEKAIILAGEDSLPEMRRKMGHHGLRLLGVGEEAAPSLGEIGWEETKRDNDCIKDERGKEEEEDLKRGGERKGGVFL